MYTIVIVDNHGFSVAKRRTVEYRLGSRFGLLHREDGPARYDAVDSVWYDNGLLTKHCQEGWTWHYHSVWVIGHLHQKSVLHREDGPALTRPDGTGDWYHCGKFLVDRCLNKEETNS